MGMSIALTGFPLMALLIVGLVGGQAVTGSTSAGVNNGVSSGGIAQGSVDCSAYPGIQSGLLLSAPNGACLASIPASGSISCGSPKSGAQWCAIFDGCPLSGGKLNCFICTTPSGSCQALAAKDTAYISSGQISSVSSSSGLFTLGSNWVTIFVVLIALACVASVSVFGIGLDGEAVHIIFLAVGLTAIWAILTGIAQFGVSGSFWASLDAATPGIALGTLTYIGLSAPYALGIFKAVSRGE